MADTHPSSPTASGPDLARQALAAYKANAKNPPTGPAKRSKFRRTDRHSGRDPVAFSALLGQVNAEQGWGIGLSGGSLFDQWATLCPQYDGKVQPVAYDQNSGRLDLRPISDAYAAQLRLLGGQLAKQINDKVGRPVVQRIRVLPVASLQAPARQSVQRADSPSPAPVRTREDGCPGYQNARALNARHKRERLPDNPL